MDELTKQLCTSGFAKENGILFWNDTVYIRDDVPAFALLEMRPGTGAHLCAPDAERGSV